MSGVMVGVGLGYRGRVFFVACIKEHDIIGQPNRSRLLLKEFQELYREDHVGIIGGKEVCVCVCVWISARSQSFIQ